MRITYDPQVDAVYLEFFAVEPGRAEARQLTEFIPPQATPLSPKGRRANRSGQGRLLVRLQPET